MMLHILSNFDAFSAALSQVVWHSFFAGCDNIDCMYNCLLALINHLIRDLVPLKLRKEYNRLQYHEHNKKLISYKNTLAVLNSS